MSDVIAPKPHDPRKRPAAGCPTCNDPSNHKGNPAAQIGCDMAAITREAAVDWLAREIDKDEARDIIERLSRVVGPLNAVRVLHVLIARGWRAPEVDA